MDCQDDHHAEMAHLAKKTIITGAYQGDIVPGVGHVEYCGGCGAWEGKPHVPECSVGRVLAWLDSVIARAP